MSAHLAVWRITPVAHPSDGAWQGRTIWQELRIVAATAGGAMYEAGRHASSVQGLTDECSQDRQQARSGFADQKLYRVDRTREAVTGPAGTVLFENIR